MLKGTIDCNCRGCQTSFQANVEFTDINYGRILGGSEIKILCEPCNSRNENLKRKHR